MDGHDKKVRAEPRILVLRGGAVGDFVLTLPALQALRREWPGAYVELIGYPHIAGLAKEGGLVDRVASLDRSDMARFFSSNAAISEEQAGYVSSFDFVLSYLYDPDGTVVRNLLATGVRQVLYCSPRFGSGHAADHFMKPLETLAIYPEGVPCPRLDLRDETVACGRDVLRRFGRDVVVLHPGSGGKAKRWPIGRFMALAEAVRKDCRAEVVFAAGEADDDLVNALRAAGEGARLLTGLSLVTLAGVLKGACSYVGNDSGITHMAAALGVPVVALFGATDPEMWGPRGDGVRILRGAVDGRPDVAGIDVKTVLEAVRPAFAR
jgi:ADP-heptose:LPS heptosyltransferase